MLTISLLLAAGSTCLTLAEAASVQREKAHNNSTSVIPPYSSATATSRPHLLNGTNSTSVLPPYPSATVTSLPHFLNGTTNSTNGPLAVASGTAYCSDQSGQYQLSQIAGPVLGSNNPGTESTWTLQVDDTPSGYKQKITGFGAAVTDATVSEFNTLSSGTLNELLETLMTSSGAGFSLMRHTIAASDLSADPAYTYDDNGGNADPNVNGFSLGDRGTAMAEMLAQMQSINPDTTILGSPWSPPGWMKLNKVIDGTSTNNNLNDGYLQDTGVNYSPQFAQYFVDYINAYENHGATINAITIQNEPLNSNPGYPTMYMYDYEQADLIQGYVGPALASSGVNIWAYDHNTDVPSYPQNVLNNAGDYVDTVAWHCYSSSLDWNVLTEFHNSNPNVNQYMTECYTPQGGAWWNAANFTLGPLQNWASGAIAWTLGSSTSDGPHLSTGGCTNCEGLVTISGGSYTLQTTYYTMAQYSKFMPRGATVLNLSQSSNYPGGIQGVATLNPDGTRTVVILNTFGNDIYLTLNTNSGESWYGNLPTASVTTWLLPAAS